MKFYPSDWRSDQALRVVSLAARGLWMEMLCIMHEASPYGHLLVAAQPVEAGVLARLSGADVSEVQAMLVELQNAGVFSRTRTGVIFSRRMTADFKRAQEGRKAKLAALREGVEKTPEKPRPSRVPKRGPSTQKPEARAKVEGGLRPPSTLSPSASADLPHEGASAPRSEQVRLVWDETAESDRLEREAADRAARKADMQGLLKDLGGKKRVRR